ncbi:transposase [Eubacterium xylanophilum]|uniref:transposase n=1 Tax=Eubacterium xylanophilum TaxID=39497 RepID=UPI003100DD02
MKSLSGWPLPVSLYLSSADIPPKKSQASKNLRYRMNRSIQAEGSFGDIKEETQFRRYLTKGAANVLAESTLLAIARNINKLHNKIQNDKTRTHLFPLKTA